MMAGSIISGISIGLLAVAVMLVIIGFVIWVIAILPDKDSEAMDEKARTYTEDRKNARIARELKARRKGGEG